MRVRLRVSVSVYVCVCCMIHACMYVFFFFFFFYIATNIGNCSYILALLILYMMPLCSSYFSINFGAGCIGSRSFPFYLLSVVVGCAVWFSYSMIITFYRHKRIFVLMFQKLWENVHLTMKFYVQYH